ncbi:lipoprotein [Spiroplasma taiwanense]|uniref:Lipoprotein n=1 Tax=Spiroplasma taiwanense CT-1 TaxID=1276220 RepID=S5MGU0_9MOLU|nr:lipoprotein [Spiroplasma taiwanense]AGR41065.1 hypothetical protein STAIW_v1c04150 [Spiroplasma taiwanense CT-1]
MKKLLCFLGSFTILTSTSISVIACNSDLKDLDENNQFDFQKLVEDFLKDLTTIKNKFWNEKNDSFFALTEFNEQEFAFLEKENIIKLVNQNNNKPVDNLSESDKTLLIQDIKKLLSEDELKSKFDSLLNKEKYSLLISNSNYFLSFDFDWSTLEINYTTQQLANKNFEKNESFISYVKIDTILHFKYYDNNFEQKFFDLNQKFVFTLTTDGSFMESIKNFEKNIKYNYFLSGQKYSFLDKDNFGIELDKNSDDIFDKKINFRNVYENQEFKNNIINFIKKKYFQNFENIPLIFKESNIFGEFILLEEF